MFLSNSNKLIRFCVAAHAKDLQKQKSTTGIVFTFIGGAIVYKSKTQSITAGSSTESKLIAAHSASKIAKYLRILLKQLVYEQKEPTSFYIDNLPALKLINDNTSPTDRTSHIYICHFSIQDWHLEGYIILVHIRDILNLSDDETNSLGYVLHNKYCCKMIRHYDG